MTRTNIRVATDILRRLGEELNPSPDQGILELVKNAYDADARNCVIELIDTDKSGGSIQITDDGDGMDVDDIVNGWLVLGRSLKSVEQRTRLGRIAAGSKGLGRLAALRLGSITTLTTRPRSRRHDQYRIRINWHAYEDADVVEDVPLDIEQLPSLTNSKSGTDILIEGLQDRISRMDVKRLARSLILLADPFADNPEAFNPLLKTPEFQDLENLVKDRYFNDAEYHLMARVDKNGNAQASVSDFRGKTLWFAEHKGLTSAANHGPYRCPLVEFDLWAFILERVPS